MNIKLRYLLIGETSFQVEVGWGRVALEGLALSMPGPVFIPTFGSLAPYGVVSVLIRVWG